MRIVLLLTSFMALAACSSTPNWRSVVVEASFAESWSAFVDIAATNGYRSQEGPEGTDRGLRTYLSKWREAPAPFRKGARTRLHGQLDRPEGRDDGWLIRFYVERQAVRDIEPGFETDEEDWSDDGQDGGREDVILGQLRLRFGQQLNITPESDRMRR